AGRPGREDDVRPGAVLDDVSDELALIRFEERSVLVEDREHRHREPRLRSGLLDAANRPALRARCAAQIIAAARRRSTRRGSVAWASGPARPRGSERLEEVGQLDAEGGGELVHRRHRGGALAELDLGDQADREARPVGELLEGQARLVAPGTDAGADLGVEPGLEVDDEAAVADRLLHGGEHLVRLERLLEIVEGLVLYRRH